MSDDIIDDTPKVKSATERKKQGAVEAIKWIPKLMEAYQWRHAGKFSEVIEQLVVALESQHPALAKKIRGAIPQQMQRVNPHIIKPEGMVEFEDPRHGIDAVILPDNIINECTAIIQEHARRDDLNAFGLSPRHKILLYGEPGNGKTMLAEALAYELDVPFLRVKYSAIITSNLGGTGRNIQDILDYAKTAPCLLFLDEFDGIGMDRNDNRDIGEMRRITNQLLISIERLPSTCVFVAATNADGLLDSALKRRFDFIIEIPKPTRELMIKCAQIELYPALTPGQNVQHLAVDVAGMGLSNLSSVVNMCRRIRRDLVLNNGQGLRELHTWI